MPQRKCQMPHHRLLLHHPQNEVYKYPDIWICPYHQYGCDSQELELECIDSAWMTEAGAPDAVFYPREKLNKLDQDTTAELQIEAIARDTGEEVSLEITRLFHTQSPRSPSRAEFTGGPTR